MKYLITGSGGREHALVKKLSENNDVSEIYCMPGNAGTAETNKVKNIEAMNIEELLLWSQKIGIDRLLAGSEDLLVQGIVDIFSTAGIESFGPHAEAAQLEGSKTFSKNFMKRNSIRTAEYENFEDYSEALEHLENQNYPIVLKADGLAAGKGVLICHNLEEAKVALTKIMKEKKFGEAGNKLVIEQYLSGFEVSIIALYDGENIIPLLSAKDHKKILDGEKGENTGGMGVIVPNPNFSEKHNKDFYEHILLPTQEGLKKEGLNFCGVIFFGLMIENEKTYLLEYNLRFGDPEIQTILSLMNSDFHEHISDCLVGKLKAEDIDWKQKYACCVVLASAGYPDTYKIEQKIDIDYARIKSEVLAAGVKKEQEVWLSNGGRVLNVIGTGDSLQEATERVYNDIPYINFEEKYYRKDIGH